MENQYKISTFGRRKNRKLSSYRNDLLQNQLPYYQILNHPINDLANLFEQKYKKFHIEIGFGTGNYLIEQVKLNDQVAYIGCEVFINGVASLLDLIKEQQYSNLKIWNQDARNLIAFLPKESIDQIDILFPDPWPKIRQNKRRLINQKLIEDLLIILKKNGKIFVATDHEDYATSIFNDFNNNKNFSCLESSLKEAQKNSQDFLQTRYQQRASKMGLDSFYFHFVKK